MWHVRICYSAIVIFLLCAVSAAAQSSSSNKNQGEAAEFEQRAREYVRMREGIEGQMPKLPKAATAEQIEAHKSELLKRVLAARTGATQGQIFTPAASAMIRSIIATEFKGRQREDLKKEVFEIAAQGVPVAVNVEYPESKEMLEVPATLLLALPQLPKQLRYRLVGTYLLLVDRENNLIIDFMPNALP